MTVLSVEERLQELHRTLSLIAACIKDGQYGAAHDTVTEHVRQQAGFALGLIAEDAVENLRAVIAALPDEAQAIDAPSRWERAIPPNGGIGG